MANVVHVLTDLRRLQLTAREIRSSMSAETEFTLVILPAYIRTDRHARNAFGACGIFVIIDSEKQLEKLRGRRFKEVIAHPKVEGSKVHKLAQLYIQAQQSRLR